jgi:hypothetical protein
MPARVDLFIQICKKEDRLPTHAGLAVYLGVCKATVENWSNEHPEFLDSLSKLNATQEDSLVNRGLKSEYNSTICKLILSSNHGYKDSHDLTTGGEKIHPQVVSFLDITKQEDAEPTKPERTNDDSE